MLLTSSDVLKGFRDKLNSFVKDAPISAEEKNRLQHYAVFLSLGIPTMMIYGLVNLFRGNFLLCLLILSSGSGLVAGLLILRKLNDGRIVYRINCILFGSLITYMMILGGEGGSKILWSYTFPLIAFFLFGKGEGLFWSAIILVMALLSFWGPLQSLTGFAYAPQYKIRFITTYLIVSAVTYWFEYFRYHYRQRLEEKNRNLEEEQERLKHEINERRRLEKELRHLASIDPLTGAANRRHFMELANKELYRLKRYNHKLALAIMDVDHFKKVNDSYGHPVGDQVLKALVQYCHIYLRKSDILGRIGGEEFAILLIETEPASVETVADRLRRKIAELQISIDNGELQFTVSIGITDAKKKDTSFAPIIKRADEALYQAKAGGRNRVVYL